jgi:hypothetical protein
MENKNALLCKEVLAGDHLLQKMKQKSEVGSRCKFSYNTTVPLYVAVADGLRAFNGSYSSG